MPAAELAAVRGLRRALQTRDGQAGLETLLERMRATPDNATFLRQVQPTLPTPDLTGPSATLPRAASGCSIPPLGPGTPAYGMSVPTFAV